MGTLLKKATQIALAAGMAFSLAPAAQAANNWYLGAGVGYSDIDICNGVPGGVSCDDNDTGWKLYGGYSFNDNIAVELGWVNLGEATVSGGGLNASAEADGWELSVLLGGKVTQNLSLYGKLGAFRWDVDAKSNFGLSGSDSGTDAVYGLGARYDFTPTAGMRLQWDRFNDVGDVDIDLWSVSLEFRF